LSPNQERDNNQAPAADNNNSLDTGIKISTSGNNAGRTPPSQRTFMARQWQFEYEEQQSEGMKEPGGSSMKLIESGMRKFSGSKWRICFWIKTDPLL
jgi:hypothetical protein